MKKAIHRLDSIKEACKNSGPFTLHLVAGILGHSSLRVTFVIMIQLTLTPLWFIAIDRQRRNVVSSKLVLTYLNISPPPPPNVKLYTRLGTSQKRDSFLWGRKLSPPAPLPKIKKLTCISTYLEAKLAKKCLPEKGGDGSLIKMWSTMQRNLLIAWMRSTVNQVVAYKGVFLRAQKYNH